MNKLSYLFTTLVLTLSISGCQKNNNNKSSSSMSESSSYSPEDEVLDDDQVVLTTKQMKVYAYQNPEFVRVDTYYRNDALKAIPYISLSTYYSLLLPNKQLTINKIDNETFEVISAANGKAVINTESDILESDNYQMFINTTIYRQDGVTNTYFDGAPFVRVKETIDDKPAKKKVINFKKYGISLFSNGNDIILPLVTASNMFQGVTMITCFYNKDNIYFVDPNDANRGTNTIIANRAYNDGITKFFVNGKRKKAEGKFAYGELCFLIDTYYGLPGRETLHTLLNQYRDLDKALLEQDDNTRKARELLQSDDQVEFFAGMYILQDYISDAGHTVANMGVQYYLYMTSSGMSSKVSDYLDSIHYVVGSKAAPRNTTSAYVNALSHARSTAGISNLKYKVSGDTVLYTFDAFDFDLAAWNNYYQSHTALPKDPVGTLKTLLDKYNNDTKIKNFVIDISQNGGGFADIVFTIMSLLTNKSYFHYHDMINDNYPTTYYEVDRNFDGLFDEHDNEVNYNYNFAIMTSGYSFSCGNILPAQAKECGIMTIGDKSGGGCCAVLDCTDSAGLYVRLSSPAHIMTLKNKEIEMGVPVDATLVGDNNDFSNFFNLSVISEKMNEFYSN